MFSLCWHGLALTSSLQSKDVLVRLIADSELAIGVHLSAKGCLSVCVCIVIDLSGMNSSPMTA